MSKQMSNLENILAELKKIHGDGESLLESIQELLGEL